MSALEIEPADVGPLRVLMVTPHYLPHVGGTEIHTYETARRIAAAGHDVTVLTTNPGGRLGSNEDAEGVRVIRVRSWPDGRDFHVSPQIYRAIAGGDWDLVHCQGIHTFVPPIAMLAAARSKTPHIVTFHSGGHSSGVRNRVRDVQWRLQRPLLSRAQRLIGVSRFEAEWFRRQLRLPSDKFVIIPNGAQLPESTDQMQTQLHETLIVSVGRLERYKGHQRVIAALPHVLAHKPEVRLRVVGSGPYESALTQLAMELGVSERVEIGAIASHDRQRMASVLSRAALVTLLSDYESQGIAVMEALKFKRPVLVSNTTALEELAERGLARSIALDSTPQDVARAILGQLDQPLIPADIDIPSWDDCAARLLAVYQDVVRSARCAS